MPFIPAPNIVQVEVRCLLAGQHIENRFNFNALTAPTAEIIADICNRVSVWTQAVYFLHLPNSVQLVEVFAKDLSSANGGVHSIAPAGVVSGAQEEPPMPNEVSFCVSLRSGSSGRSARGRAFVLAICKAWVTGNNLLALEATGFANAFQSLIDTMETAGTPMTIVSYIANKVPRPGGPVYFPVVNATAVDNVVDSMRRRKPGNGS